MIMVHTSTETLLVKKLQKGKSSLFHALYVAVYNYVVINKYISAVAPRQVGGKLQKWVTSRYFMLAIHQVTVCLSVILVRF